ncbi:MAG: MFS transporter [Acidimicrobiia bacterium]|nr:MFS transporter [Acidimicrobiia bacterium]MDH5522148.1 MFS transporter [Acidimicrobiia bacterium]
MHRRPGHARHLYWTVFVFSGAALTLIGPALTELRERTGTGIGDIGVLFVALSLGGVVGSLVAGHLLDRFDGHRIYAAAAVSMALGQASVPFLDSIQALTVAFAVIGLGAMALGTASNALMMWWRDADVGRGLNVLHLCFGVGAIVAPLLALIAVDLAFWCSAAAVGLFGLVALTIDSPEPVHVKRDDQMNTTVPVVALAAVFFAFYVAFELGYSGWLHTYGVERGLSIAAASWLNSAFWIAFTLGRAAVAFRRVLPAPKVVVTGSLAVAVGGSVLLVLGGAGVGPLIWIGTILAGLGAAAQFPMMMTYLDRRIVTTGRFTSILLASAAGGNLTAPWLIGRAIDSWGPMSLMWAALIIASALSLVFAALNRLLGG